MSTPIVCPKCGTAIKLENDEYMSIVNQVRNDEFNKEIEKRMADEKRHIDEKIRLAESNVKLEMQKELSEKDNKILELNKTNKHITDEATKAVRKHEAAFNELKASSSAEISKLHEQLRLAEEIKKAAVSNAISEEQQHSKEKDVEIARLREALNTKDANSKLELASVSSEKEKVISELNAKILSINASYAAKEAANEEKFREQLKAKDEEIQFYKDYKSKLNTKMIGESLEEHCYAEYSRLRVLMPNSQFYKDNEISESGSKGDFIFRDFSEDGKETLSIMFEMKNEADDSVHKHKNKDFLKELDKDRREKKCEYAVLVSLLEPDSDYYNQGIVPVPEYEKMYVIRPQSFIAMISVLKYAALKSVDLIKELEECKATNIDVTTFEADLAEYKAIISKTSNLAKNNKNKAIADIDKAISALQAAKEELEKFDTHMGRVESNAEKLTIKKLVAKAPRIESLIYGKSVDSNEEAKIEPKPEDETLLGRPA